MPKTNQAIQNWILRNFTIVGKNSYHETFRLTPLALRFVRILKPREINGNLWLRPMGGPPLKESSVIARVAQHVLTPIFL